MVTSSAEDIHGKKKEKVYRLFLVGQKQLPEIVEGKSTSKERNWALNILTTSNVQDIHKELLPAEYTTETRGKRRLAAAAPAGEGKYSIVKHDGHTELAYLLELPQELGPTQKEFEIRKEASYIISVKNPVVNVPGFAAFSSARKPEYPKRLMEMFGDRRWMDVENSELLDYKNTQLLLIGDDKTYEKESSVIKTDNENDNKPKLIVEEDDLKLELFRKQRESEQLGIDPDQILDEEEKRQLSCQQDL